MFWFGDGGLKAWDALGECQRSRKESNGDGRPLNLCWCEGTGYPATQAFFRDAAIQAPLLALTNNRGWA